MSRPPRPAKPASENALIPLNDERLASGSDALTEMSAADEAVMEVSDLLMTVGAMQGMHFCETVASVTLVKLYEAGREKFKKIKYLPVRLPGGGAKRVSSLKEFCEVVIGKTQRRCQQLADNYHTVGPELYEQAEQLGMRQQDYATIKALPDDTREQVKEAIKSGDPLQLKTLLSEVSARNEAQKKAIADLEQTNAVKDKLLDKKNKEIDAKDEKLARPFKPPEFSAARTKEQQAMLDELTDGVVAVDNGIRRLAAAADVIFGDGKLPEAMKLQARKDMEWLAQILADVLLEYGIEVDFEERITPTWLKGMKAKLEEKKANGKGSAT